MTDRKISYYDKQMIQGYCHKIFRRYRWLNSRNIRPHLRKKKFKLIKYFKIYSNLSSPFATSYSVQNAVFNNLPEALTSAKAALFDNGVKGGGGGFPIPPSFRNLYQGNSHVLLDKPPPLLP